MKTTLKELAIQIRDYIYRLMLTFLGIFPVKKNKILVSNFCGRGYGDNPKYIVEEIKRRSSKYKIYWQVYDKKTSLPEYIKPVKYKSFAYLWHLATAEVWIDNVRKEPFVRKRVNQVYLQTWHGSFSSKLIEKDAETHLNARYIAGAKNDSKMIDGVLVNCLDQEDLFKRVFWLDDFKKIIRCGYPRNDYIINNKSNHEKIVEIKKELGINVDFGVVLYAPTFRDDLDVGVFNLDFSRIIETFEEKYSKDFCIIIRLHPNIQDRCDFVKYNKNIINGSLCGDIQDLYLVSDFLISDYSSTPYDFSLLGKPSFLLLSDIGKYKEKRGLLPEFMKVPFVKAYSIDELINEIKRFDFPQYNSVLFNYFKKHPVWDNGTSTIEIVDWMVTCVNEKRNLHKKYIEK